MPIALETASHGLLWPLLTSARTLEYRSPDLPRHLRRRARRPPRVRTMAFLPHPPDLLVPPFGQRASSCTADLPGDTSLIRFLFVGSEFRIRLPSGHTSRWNPCPLLTVLLTYGSGLSPVVIAHAGHTVPARRAAEAAGRRAATGSASLRSREDARLALRATLRIANACESDISRKELSGPDSRRENSAHVCGIRYIASAEANLCCFFSPQSVRSDYHCLPVKDPLISSEMSLLQQSFRRACWAHFRK